MGLKVSTTNEPTRVFEVDDAEYDALKSLGILTPEARERGDKERATATKKAEAEAKASAKAGSEATS